MKIGVIGIGVVGYPLYKALQYHHKDVYCWDIEKPCDEWGHILGTDITFVCVPTDKGKDNRLDMRHVESVLEKLDKTKYKGITVIKSTLRLGYIKKAMKQYNLRIAVFPEWLRAKHALADTLSSEMTVVGIDSKEDQKYVLHKIVKAYIWHTFSNANIVEPEEAVIIKLAANALAATKISFANQIKLICEAYDINEDVVMDIVRTDPRCAPRYLNPGGPYGGACLQKDTSELMHCIVDADLLNGVELINEKMKERSE